MCCAFPFEEIMNNLPIQVVMAPFGLRFGRNEAKWFDKHVYMPPGSVLGHILLKIGWWGVPQNAGPQDCSKLKTATMAEELSAWGCQMIDFL